MRGGLHQLIRLDVFDGALQREHARGRELDGIVLGGGAVVGEVLFARGVHRNIDGFRVLAHNHAFVHLIAGGNEERAALLHGLQGVGAGNAVLHGDERAGLAGGDFACVGGVFLEKVGENAVATGKVHQLKLEADEPAGGDGGLDSRAAISTCLHILQDAAAVAQDAHRAVGALVRHLDVDRLERLAVHAVNLAHNYLRAGDQHLVILAAHLLHQNGNLHRTAGRHHKHARQIRILHLDGYIRAHLAHQTVANHAARHILTIAATQRTIVDTELHLHRRRLNLDKRQRLALRVSRQRLADIHILEPGKADNVARLAHRRIRCLQTAVLKKFCHLRLHPAAILAEQVQRIPLLHAAARDAAHRHATHIIIPIDIGNQHLERLIRVSILRGGNVLHNLVQQRRAIHRGLTLRVVHEITIAGRAIHKRCLKLLLRCIQIQQQLQHLVMHLHGVGMRAVNLIDDHDG